MSDPETEEAPTRACAERAAAKSASGCACAERAATIVDEWFNAIVHNSPVSRIPDALAHMQHARDDLKARLRSLDKEP